MGPVRVGTRDYSLVQHDVYGQVILAITQMFFDKRLKNPGDKMLFERLEGIGNQAVKNYNQPDAGPLGLSHENPKIHTFSSVMCWVATDRLNKIANHIGLTSRAEYWGKQAVLIQKAIIEKCWNESLKSFTDIWEGSEVDGFLLLLADLGFLRGDDPRFASTVERVEKSLRRGKFICSASQKGVENSPVCSSTITFWYIAALATLGRRDEARDLFEHMLTVCNPVGLLSEAVNADTGELWGNFPKTTAMVGLIDCALRLSKDWEDVI